MDVFNLINMRLKEPHKWATIIGNLSNGLPKLILHKLYKNQSNYYSDRYTSNYDSNNPYLCINNGDKNIYIKCGDKFTPELVEELLKKYVVNSPYGNLTTGETEINKEVRYSYDINEKKTKLYVNHYFEKNDNIIDLFGGHRLSIEHYKTTIYTPGGHFKEHVDTPVSEDMIGTIVVCWPSEFEGGEFVINCGNEDEEVLDWSRRAQNTVQLVAFMCDTVHKVCEVKSGYRVVSTFNVCAMAEPREITYNEERDERENIEDERKIDIQYIQSLKDYINSNGKIGIIMRHQYQKNAPLKGIDKRIYDTLIKDGYTCEFNDVIYNKLKYTEEKDESDFHASEENDSVYSAANILDPNPEPGELKRPIVNFYEAGVINYDPALTIPFEDGIYTGNTYTDAIMNTYYRRALVITSPHYK